MHFFRLSLYLNVSKFNGIFVMTKSIPLLDVKIETTSRELHFFWILDCSGSMSGKRIAMLNQGIIEALPLIIDAAKSKPRVNILMRAIKFSNRASWHIGSKPVPIEKFVWKELINPQGRTSTAKAIRLLTEELDVEKMTGRHFPPVCILISDGFCTDPEGEYDRAIADLETIPWGMKAVRLSIGLGEYDSQQLLKFVSPKEVGVLEASNVHQILDAIKWASTEAIQSSSQSRSDGGDLTKLKNNVTMGKPENAGLTSITSSTEVF